MTHVWTRREEQSITTQARIWAYINAPKSTRVVSYPNPCFRCCLCTSRRQLVPFFSTISIYPSQTNILEGWTKDEILIFEALFKGVSTRFGLRTIEKSVENMDFISCSAFQNLRLGSIQLRTFRQTFQGGFVVDTFVEMFKMEIVEKKGTSCRRLWVGRIPSNRRAIGAHPPL